jgi:hypothetical protein
LKGLESNFNDKNFIKSKKKLHVFYIKGALKVGVKEIAIFGAASESFS